MIGSVANDVSSNQVFLQNAVNHIAIVHTQFSESLECCVHLVYTTQTCP